MRFLFYWLLLFSAGMSAQADTLLGLPLLPGDTGEVFKVLEQMPLFPYCDEFEGDYVEHKRCSDTKMIDYVYNVLEYPEGLELERNWAMMVVSFIVERDGRMTSVRITRRGKNPKPKVLEQEALRIVHAMATELAPWRPGMQGGEARRVVFNLPIKFVQPK